MPPKSATASRTQSARAPPCCTCLRGSEQTGLDVTTKEGKDAKHEWKKGCCAALWTRCQHWALSRCKALTPPARDSCCSQPKARADDLLGLLGRQDVLVLLELLHRQLNAAQPLNVARHGGELRESGGLQRRAPGQLCASLGLVAFVRCALRSTGGMARAWQW